MEKETFRKAQKLVDKIDNLTREIEKWEGYSLDSHEVYIKDLIDHHRHNHFIPEYEISKEAFDLMKKAVVTELQSKRADNEDELKAI